MHPETPTYLEHQYQALSYALNNNQGHNQGPHPWLWTQRRTAQRVQRSLISSKSNHFTQSYVGYRKPTLQLFGFPVVINRVYAQTSQVTCSAMGESFQCPTRQLQLVERTLNVGNEPRLIISEQYQAAEINTVSENGVSTPNSEVIVKLIFKLRKTSWLINVLRDQLICDGGGGGSRLHSVGGTRIKRLSALTL